MRFVAEPSVSCFSCSAAVLALEVLAAFLDVVDFLFDLLFLNLKMYVVDGRFVVGAVILLAVEQGLQRGDLSLVQVFVLRIGLGESWSAGDVAFAGNLSLLL